jgi:hypothetical protein
MLLNDAFPYKRFEMTDIEASDLKRLFSFYEATPEKLSHYLLKISPTIILKYCILPSSKDEASQILKARIINCCTKNEALKAHFLGYLNQMTGRKGREKGLAYSKASALHQCVACYLYKYRSSSCVLLYQLEREKKAQTFAYENLLEQISSNRDIAPTYSMQETKDNYLVLNKAAELGHFDAARVLAQIWYEKDKNLDEKKEHTAKLMRFAMDYHAAKGIVLLIRYIWGREETPRLEGNSILYLAHLAKFFVDYGEKLGIEVGEIDELLSDYFAELPGFNKSKNLIRFLSVKFGLPETLFLKEAEKEAIKLLSLRLTVDEVVVKEQNPRLFS